MSAKRVQQIEKRIADIKEELLKIGPMRPGSLTRQYRNPENNTGAYWQVSYTRHKKSRTEYVRPDCVAQVRKEIATHKMFRSLVEEWTDLGIEYSKLRVQLARTTKTKRTKRTD